MAVLEIRNLRTYYQTGGEVAKAIDGISFDIESGEALGIVGRSGSGKSVLARSILGLVREPGRVVDGEIRFDGRNLLELNEAQLEQLRGQDLALIVSNPRSHLNPLVGVGSQIANVIQAKQGLSKKAAFPKAVELISSVDIADPRRVATMLPHELSGGMCQRIIIAMALASNPRLIIADEPTAGLDVTVQLQVLELMVSLVRDHRAALLMATRDLGIVAHYCQRIAVLEKGQIVEIQSVRSFFSDPQHPHSKFLLRAAFAARGEERQPTTERHS
jgi:peptide/nickel transport system ATP-binding protein